MLSLLPHSADLDPLQTFNGRAGHFDPQIRVWQKMLNRRGDAREKVSKIHLAIKVA